MRPWGAPARPPLGARPRTSPSASARCDLRIRASRGGFHRLGRAIVLGVECKRRGWFAYLSVPPAPAGVSLRIPPLERLHARKKRTVQALMRSFRSASGAARVFGAAHQGRVARRVLAFFVYSLLLIKGRKKIAFLCVLWRRDGRKQPRTRKMNLKRDKRRECEKRARRKGSEATAEVAPAGWRGRGGGQGAGEGKGGGASIVFYKKEMTPCACGVKVS